MLQRAYLVLGAILFLSLVHCQDRTPYDPSTVINVYPSLASLRKSQSSRSSSSFDPDADCEYKEVGCASASNVQPTWTRKDEKDEKEGPVPDLMQDLKVKDPKKMKTVHKHKFLKDGHGHLAENQERTTVTPGGLPKMMPLSEDEKKKIHNWSSLQDMLQLLKKRKH